jgi:hypothetical protein
MRSYNLIPSHKEQPSPGKSTESDFYTKAVVLGIDIGIQGVGVYLRKGAQEIFAKTLLFEVPETGLERELMLSGSDKCSNKTLRGPQPETVKHYRLIIDGKVVAEESFNYLRKRIQRLQTPQVARIVKLEILAAHGVPEARVFEVCCY